MAELIWSLGECATLRCDRKSKKISIELTDRFDGERGIKGKHCATYGTNVSRVLAFVEHELMECFGKIQRG